MANDNKPIWKDYPLYCGNGDYVIEELVNGTWQTRKRFHVLRTPYGGGEVAANDMLCADLKTGYPETTGVTTHSAAYRRYRCQTGSTASQTQVFNFCQDWSYDEWDGEARTLSAPINGHADMRQRLFRSRFGETEEEIEIKTLVRPQFSFDYSSDVNADNTAGYLTITANEDYTIYCGSSWIQNLGTGGTEGEQTFYFYIEPYTGYTDRSTVIEITYLDYEGNYETVELPLVQRAIVPFFNVYPVEQSVDYTSGTTVFVANTNVPFNVSENASWLELQGITQAGYQAYNVAFNYSANTGDARQTVITFTYPVSATQSGTTTAVLRQVHAPNISIEPQFKEITSVAQGIRVQVSSETPWVSSTSYNWLSAPSSGVSGVTLIFVNSTANTGSTQRNGSVIFSNGPRQATFTVNQDKPDDATKIIRYVSTDNQIVTPYRTGSTYYGASIVSNTYYPDRGYGEIKFDGDVTQIGGRAFYECNTLSSIKIPDSVTTIGGVAFYNCESLQSITIPDSVTTIGLGAFSDCSVLSSVTIGSGITSISEEAFADCTSLTSITIPDSVTTIGIYAFGGCHALSSIIIPDSVTNIHRQALWYCTSLSSIYYNGTQAQWASIIKGDDWKFRVPATVVHCTDGDTPI